jgi:hypothetical protein
MDVDLQFRSEGRINSTQLRPQTTPLDAIRHTCTRTNAEVDAVENNPCSRQVLHLHGVHHLPCRVKDTQEDRSLQGVSRPGRYSWLCRLSTHALPTSLRRSSRATAQSHAPPTAITLDGLPSHLTIQTSNTGNPHPACDTISHMPPELAEFAAVAYEVTANSGPAKVIH